MRFVTLTIALVLSSGPLSALASSGFLNSCDDIQLGNGYTITTRCQPANPKLARRPTGLDLNLCIANAHGTMVPRDRGGFGNSCNGCLHSTPGISNPPGELTCDCLQGNGAAFTFADIQLNNFISNNDGHLECFGHFGS